MSGVKVQRKVVGREDLAERDRRRVGRHRHHVPVVHAVPAQRLVDEAAERVVAGTGDHRHAAPVPGRGHRDVGRAAAEVLAEGLDVLQPDTDLQRVDVDADPAHGQDFE